MRFLISTAMLMAILVPSASAQRYYARERLQIVPSTSAEPPAETKGQVLNGGFEDGVLSPWTAVAGNAAIVKNNVRSGVYSVRFDTAGMGISQVIATEARNYTLSFSCYATGGYPVRIYWNGVMMGYCGSGGNSAWISSTVAVRGTGGDVVLMFASPTGTTGRGVDDVVLRPS
jgi:hypothetical protein